MAIIISWILFGVAAAIAASNKGRDGFRWFFLGVLFGPFGLLFALLLKPLAEPAPAGARTNAGRKCPFCAETIKAEAKLCRFCGRDLPPNPAIATAAASDAAESAAIKTKVNKWERRWRRMLGH